MSVSDISFHMRPRAGNSGRDFVFVCGKKILWFYFNHKNSNLRVSPIYKIFKYHHKQKTTSQGTNTFISHKLTFWETESYTYRVDVEEAEMRNSHGDLAGETRSVYAQETANTDGFVDEAKQTVT